jgi:hypothetical protein
MKSFFQTGIWVFTILALGLGVQESRANLIDVSYYVTGTSGDYTLEFTVANNLTSVSTSDVYQFGIDLGDASIIKSPSGYADFANWKHASNGISGGSNITYDLYWLDSQHFNLLTPGQSLSGFSVHSKSLVAPPSIKWFAFAANFASTPTHYMGGGNFYESNNLRLLGFEGTASQVTPPAAVPEPATLSLAAIGGLASVLYFGRKRRRIAN